jgi:hypothetical protein
VDSKRRKQMKAIPDPRRVAGSVRALARARESENRTSFPTMLCRKLPIFKDFISLRRYIGVAFLVVRDHRLSPMPNWARFPQN